MKDKSKLGLKSVISSAIALRYVWVRDKEGKKYIIWKSLSSILNAFLPLILVLFPGRLINELIEYQRDINKIIFYVIMIVGAPVVLWGVNRIIDYLTTNIKSSFNNNSNAIYYRRLTEIDYEELETPKTEQIKDRASRAISRLLDVVDHYCSLISSIIQFCLVISLVLTLNVWIVLLVLGVAAINFFASKWLKKKARESEVESGILNNRFFEYLFILDYKNYYKETRIFNSTEYLITHIAQIENEINSHDLKFRKKENYVGFISVLGGLLQKSLLYVYLIRFVINGIITVGTMTIYVSSVEQLTNSINNLISSYLDLMNLKYTMDDINDFMELPRKQLLSGSEPLHLGETFTIEFRNIGFKYPGSERYALRNLNIKINSNEHLCIVGENGSGKSTFIKLLTRMYYPTEGEILINGRNVYDYDYKDYLDKFGAVFQDFGNYNFRLNESVALCDEIDEEKFNYSISTVHLEKLVESLPKKGYTMLGKAVEEDGFEPSGGELQRIAIARMIYHGGDILILDEPTASLDPIAENEIYEQFHNMLQGKCGILVTHRLSAVQLADKVAVFSNGEIEEYGTHKELYEKGGIYKKMFDTQAQFYRESTS